MSSSLSSTPIYKGKYTHRSWQQLPPEIIRHIATFQLIDASYTSYCPHVWEARQNWLPRMLYTTLRDSLDMERLMTVCPSWAIALETHTFWQQACAFLDPQSVLAHHAIIRVPISTTGSAHPQMPIRLTPYRHFRTILNCSCFVCRINSPHTSVGVGTATRRSTATPFLPFVPICKEHRRHTFCGLCLREAPPLESENDFNAVCCFENEDEETWPGVDATCRACRIEWLWHRVASNPLDREAVGGHKWESPDWETRQRIEAFIEMGDGTIGEVVQLAQEKHWFRRFTKLPDMLSQAVAASRYTNCEDRQQDPSDVSSDTGSIPEEEEDDYELLGLTEDASNVRNLAISDWARSRILDGYWISPADEWYGRTSNNTAMVVRAEHPCPWSVSADGEDHPLPETIRSEIPPSYHLCEQSYIAYQRQMHAILLPAMRNLVRKLVLESAADGADATLRASRMSLEEVARELTDEGVWYNGIDWLECRRNKQREEIARARSQRESNNKFDGDDSSSSSKSHGSQTTSPLSSASTLHTSPSPPPIEEKPATMAPKLAIPVSPVLSTPELIHPIPYIPLTLGHLPPYSLEAFKIVWREASAPLYECSCSICQRAAIQANGGQQVPPAPITSQAQPVTAPQPPLEICIEEVHVDEDNKDEVDDEERESEESGDETGGDSDEASCDRNGEVERWRNARKRSSAELDDPVDETGPSVETDERGGKRARRLSTGAEEPLDSGNTERMKRRTPDEVDDDSTICDNIKRRKSSTADDDNHVEQQAKKRPATPQDDASELSPYRPSRSCRLRATSPPTDFRSGGIRQAVCFQSEG